MTIAAGLLLGAGFVLALSPWLWPRAVRTNARSAGPLAGLERPMRQAGLARTSPIVLVIVSALLGVAGAALTLALIPVVALAGVVGLVITVIPMASISARARRRRAAARAGWPDLVDHLVAGLRAGQSLAAAIGGLATVGVPESRAAFAEFEQTVRATGTIGPALDQLKDRLADPVADRIVETLRVAREVGGSELPGVLRALAASLRADAAVRAEAQARQSWVVIAARLGVAAPWIVLLLIASRPEAGAAYNSPAGLALLGVGLAVTVMAYRLMVVLGRLPEERRWFS